MIGEGEGGSQCIKCSYAWSILMCISIVMKCKVMLHAYIMKTVSSSIDDDHYETDPIFTLFFPSPPIMIDTLKQLRNQLQQQQEQQQQHSY